MATRHRPPGADPLWRQKHDVGGLAASRRARGSGSGLGRRVARNSAEQRPVCPEFDQACPHCPGRAPLVPRARRCRDAVGKGLPGMPDGCPLVRVYVLHSWTARDVLPSEPPPFPKGQGLGGRHQAQVRQRVRTQGAGIRPPRPPSLGSRVGAPRAKTQHTLGSPRLDSARLRSCLLYTSDAADE